MHNAMPQVSGHLPNKPNLKGELKGRRRKSKAHPAFGIILSPDAERYQLPPTNGYFLVPKLSLRTIYLPAKLNWAIIFVPKCNLGTRWEMMV